MIVSRDEKWKIGLSHLNEYYGSHGHCNVPHRYISPDGYHLGIWVQNQRTAVKRGKLSHEKIELLSKLHFTFIVNDYNSMWLNGYNHLLDYYNNCGDANVPHRYISPDGYHLGQWVKNQRTAIKRGKLCRERYELLSNLNFRFNVKNTNTMWLNGYNHLIDYFNNCGNVNVPQSYISPDGYRLGQWVFQQRQVFKRNRLDHERYELLKKIKFSFDTNRSNPEPAWENGYNHLIDYCRIHKSVKVPARYISPDGFKLGYWVFYNQINYKLLSITQIKKLEATGFFPLWHETHTW
ncbi:helicase associated domain-containing protein [Aristaeella lactis]|uniref:Helicase associated domain-containing protein n=1 Tax=Aristaeella lactis TaxID=3046383 RepID=A0AC61PJD7_9FIRM|nr:helicase associated domain-containing protein [Aristaeella lactis]QUA54108.1 helicase associated domain-containing protein [Aristaeella lactis]SMC43585.1 Helicase associated domain-containing protein [Aristaeella lactis]